MNIRLAKIYGGLIAGLAVLGLLTSSHLFNLMNVDIALDMLRVLLAAYLLYVAFGSRSENAAGTALLIVGTLYVGMAVVGLISPTVGGLLPAGLTGFDVLFHMATGIVALYAGAHKNAHLPANS